MWRPPWRWGRGKNACKTIPDAGNGHNKSEKNAHIVTALEIYVLYSSIIMCWITIFFSTRITEPHLWPIYIPIHGNATSYSFAVCCRFRWCLLFFLFLCVSREWPSIIWVIFVVLVLVLVSRDQHSECRFQWKIAWQENSVTPSTDMCSHIHRAAFQYLHLQFLWRFKCAGISLSPTLATRFLCGPFSCITTFFCARIRSRRSAFCVSVEIKYTIKLQIEIEKKRSDDMVSMGSVFVFFSYYLMWRLVAHCRCIGRLIDRTMMDFRYALN